MGMLHVLEAARAGEIDRVVWSSSVAVCGPHEYYSGPLSDNATHYPQNLYGASKSYAEFLARHYYGTFQLDSVGLR